MEAKLSYVGNSIGAGVCCWKGVVMGSGIDEV